MGRRLPYAGSLGLLLLAAPLLHADELRLVAIRDNTLYDAGFGLLSNGAGIHFFAGRSLAHGNRRGLVAFDLSGGLPPEARIVAVELRLSMSKTTAGPVPIGLHRVTAPWGEGTSDAPGEEGGGAIVTEGDATWYNSIYDTALWDEVGGDFDPWPSAVEDVDDPGIYVFSSVALADDVRGWLADPASNFGWIVLGVETQMPTTKRFDTREHPDFERRPLLTITYETGQPVPALSAPGALLLTLLLLLASSVLTGRSRQGSSR